MTSGTPPRMAAWLESAWLARYLDRQLEGEELAWFEAYLLDKPELVEAVETENALRSACFDGGISKAPDANLRLAMDQQSHESRTRRVSRVLALCSLLAGVGVGSLAQTFLRGGERVIANPPRIVIDTERGESSGADIRGLTSGVEYMLVDLALPVDAKGARVHYRNGEAILTIDNDGFATFIASKGLVEGGIYVTYESYGRTFRKDIP